ncbi:LytR/AlgR family response regulator transcription factor [Mucilaginibacter sp.]|uniref:LytR/AlgR family response regulator transcription factor n=1 Tax=Mucilaginibacter sp. TaxID=1882438 RepID=UPI003D0F3A90
MNYTCYIIDDENHALELLRDYIEKTPGLTLAGTATNPLVALQEIAALRPALAFVDVDMPEMSGMQVAELINKYLKVVFTTSFRDYALEAFEKEAADYLLKPISYEKFLKCIQKIRSQSATVSTAERTERATFFIKTGTKGKLLQIDLNEIIYVAAASNYIDIYTTGQQIVAYLTLRELLEILPAAGFSQIHRSYIVNHAFIHSLEVGQVRMCNQAELPIGRSYREGFQDKMNLRTLISKRENP